MASESTYGNLYISRIRRLSSSLNVRGKSTKSLLALRRRLDARAPPAYMMNGAESPSKLRASLHLKTMGLVAPIRTMLNLSDETPPTALAISLSFSSPPRSGLFSFTIL